MIMHKDGFVAMIHGCKNIYLCLFLLTKYFFSEIRFYNVQLL